MLENCVLVQHLLEPINHRHRLNSDAFNTFDILKHKPKIETVAHSDSIPRILLVLSETQEGKTHTILGV